MMMDSVESYARSAGAPQLPAAKYARLRAGHNFHLLVDQLEAAITRAVAAGGSPLMSQTQVDGYDFAVRRIDRASTLNARERSK